MYATRMTVNLTTLADGSCTGYSDAIACGRVLAVVVSTGFDNGYGVTVTAEATGETILTLTSASGASSTYPRQPVHDETGSGATYDGTNAIREPLTVVNDRVKIVVASGGNVKTATVTLIIG